VIDVTLNNIHFSYIIRHGSLLLLQEPGNNHHTNLVQVANKQYNIKKSLKIPKG